ncbi:MAG: hypothetical protein ACLKAN_13070 [Alkaliphilus sp.]
MAVRKTARESTTKLHQNVSEVMPKFYEGTYKLETVVDSQEDSEEYILKYISKIKERNRKQGVSGKYSVYADFPYTTIKNIIKLKEIDIKEELMDTILEALLETLFCPKQLLLDKIEAIQLIIFIKINSNKTDYDFKNYMTKIKNDEEIVLRGRSDFFLFKQTEKTIQFNFTMMQLVFNDLDYIDLLDILGAYGELNEFEKIEALKALISVFENGYADEIDKIFLFMILQFALGLSRSTNHDVRYHSIRLLLLIMTDDTKKPILTQLSKTMDYDSGYIKNLIINKIDALITINLDIGNFIMQKASVDNHYIIRKCGCEFIEKQ